MTDKQLTERERIAYDLGFQDALCAFAYSSSAAWATSGVQYVGTSGTPLRKALEERRETYNYNPRIEL